MISRLVDRVLVKISPNSQANKEELFPRISSFRVTPTRVKPVIRTAASHYAGSSLHSGQPEKSWQLTNLYPTQPPQSQGYRDRPDSPSHTLKQFFWQNMLD